MGIDMLQGLNGLNAYNMFLMVPSTLERLRTNAGDHYILLVLLLCYIRKNNGPMGPTLGALCNIFLPITKASHLSALLSSGSEAIWKLLG